MDDPILASVGAFREFIRSEAILLIFWMLLGIPLAWAKCQELDASQEYD